jgi:hypothetical protein
MVILVLDVFQCNTSSLVIPEEKSEITLTRIHTYKGGPADPRISLSQHRQKQLMCVYRVGLEEGMNQ